MKIAPVGAEREIAVSARVVAATNRDLPRLVAEGRFREDLYYRLSVVQLELPPLRRRGDDLALLARKFLTELHGAEALEQVKDFDRAIEALKRHDWPGNVRELRNLIEVAFYSERRPVDLTAFLGLGQLRAGRTPVEPEPIVNSERPFKDAKNELIDGFEKSYLQALLSRNNNNVSRSAREAGIERAYLQRLVRKHGLKT
jgi:transcriptional regulator with GAF, ATPase, and Fis domain